MNSPNYPPQGPYGPPQGQPYGPPQTPPGGQPYGGPPPQGPPFGAPPPQGPPYGAPPPQGQPFGGPPPGGFGPPPGGPAGPPPAAFPPPAPVAKSGGAGKVIKILVAVAVVGAAVVFGIMNWGTSAANAKVGECIKVTDSTNADIEKIDCNSAEAAYKVGATFDSSTATCPEGDYVSYTQGGRRTSDVTLCLILNAEEGDCFAEEGQANTKVDCAAANAAFQVGAILNDTVDESGCPETTEYYKAYSEPKPMVQCLTSPGGGTTTS